MRETRMFSRIARRFGRRLQAAAQGQVVERRRLGQSTLSVPVIGMGTWRTFDTDEDRRRENAVPGNPPFFAPDQRALVVSIAERA